ncbi:MAG: hypothetical protein KAS72_09970 [Phycisphaerales bacterium]|nr:hypothetical protein [Phycisphaerales bacterium]
MNILILSRTPLCGIPLQLARALNRHTPHHAHCVVLRGDYDNGRVFDVDLIRSEMHTADFQGLLDDADVVHFFNYVHLDSREFGVNFREFTAGKRFCIQYHSQPEHIALHSGFRDTCDVIAKDHTQIFVTAEYLRLYDAAVSIPIPIIIPLDDERFRAVRKWSETDGKIHIAYAPALPTEVIPGWEIWTSKGYTPTCRALESLARDVNNVQVHVIENIPHRDCCLMRQQCDIAIDEVVSGAYHTNSLETLAMGVATVCHIDAVTEEVNSRITGADEHPWIDATLDTLRDVLAETVADVDRLRERQRYSRWWMETYWNESRLAELYSGLYEGLPVHTSEWDRRHAVTATQATAWRRPQLIRGAYDPAQVVLPQPCAEPDTTPSRGDTILFYPINENHVTAFQLLAEAIQARDAGEKITFFVVAEALANRPMLKRALADVHHPVHRIPAGEVVRFVRKERPAVVVWSVGDTDPTKVRLIDALQKMRIRSVAIEEGNQLSLNAGELSFYALPFDAICAASDAERNALIDAGFPTDVVTVTGAVSLEVTRRAVARCDPTQVRARLGIPEGKRVAVYTTSPLRRYQPSSFDAAEDRDAILRLIDGAQRNDLYWILKLHPCEVPYRERLAENPLARCTQIIGDEATWPELLSILDVVVNRGNSMTAMEATMLGKPVIVVPLGLPTIFEQDGDARRVVTSLDDFSAALDGEANIPPMFAKRHFVPGDATIRIASVILDAARSPRRSYASTDAFTNGILMLQRAGRSAARICWSSSVDETDARFDSLRARMDSVLDDRRDQPQRALETLESVIADFKPTRELLIEAMLVALGAGDASLAQRYLAQAADASWLLSQSDRHTPALRYAQEAIRLGESSGSSVLDEWISRRPELMDAMVLRLISDWMIDGPGDTQDLRRRIRELRPDGLFHSEVYGRLTACLDLERMNEAGLSRLIARCPDLPQARFFLAKLRRADGKLDEALALLEEEHRRFDPQPRIMIQRASVLREAGEYVDAAVVLDDAEARFGSPEWLWCERGWLHEARGEPDRALACYEREDELYPRKGWVVENIQRVRDRLAEREEVVTT